MTGDGADDERLSFLGRPLPSAFVAHAVTIPAGASLAFDAAAWDDAIVVLETGDLEVECLRGGRRRFVRGAVICLVELELRTLHSVGADAVRMVSITRREKPDSGIA